MHPGVPQLHLPQERLGGPARHRDSGLRRRRDPDPAGRAGPDALELDVADEVDHGSDLGEVESRMGDEPADHRQPERVVAEMLAQVCRDARVRELRGSPQGRDLSPAHCAFDGVVRRGVEKMMRDTPGHRHRGLPRPRVVAPADVPPQLAPDGVRTQPRGGHEHRHGIRGQEVVGQRRQRRARILPPLRRRRPIRKPAQPVAAATRDLEEAGGVGTVPAGDRPPSVEHASGGRKDIPERVTVPGVEREALRVQDELVCSLFVRHGGPTLLRSGAWKPALPSRRVENSFLQACCAGSGAQRRHVAPGADPYVEPGCRIPSAMGPKTAASVGTRRRAGRKFNLSMTSYSAILRRYLSTMKCRAEPQTPPRRRRGADEGRPPMMRARSFCVSVRARQPGRASPVRPSRGELRVLPRAAARCTCLAPARSRGPG